MSGYVGVTFLSPLYLDMFKIFKSKRRARVKGVSSDKTNSNPYIKRLTKKDVCVHQK